MPAIDFNTSISHPEYADIVIIGAGAAGLYLANELSKTCSVIVLESGDTGLREDRQQLNQIGQSGKELISAVDGRKRVLGGTTVAWGGQSLPFSSMDFDKREWVTTNEWPFRIGDLTPHYRRANRVMRIDEYDYEDELFEKLKHSRPAFDPLKIRFHFSKWAPEPNFTRIFQKQIERRFTVIYNCHFLDFEIRENSVCSIKFGNFNDSRGRLSCKHVIVAAGGLESNRILLCLQRNWQVYGKENSPLLGAGFMDHPSIFAGTVDVKDNYRFQRIFNTQIRWGRKYSLRLSAGDHLQRSERTLNATGAFIMKPPADEFDIYSEFKQFSKYATSPRNIFSAAASLTGLATALLKDGFVYKKGAQPVLGMCSEQEPLLDNRIRLSEEVDRFGTPKISLNWSISAQTLRTVKEFAQIIGSEMKRLALGDVILRPELLPESELTPDLFYDIGHHMGGTPTGSDPRSSIVSPDLRVWCLSNLWICSASIFVTGSHSNPTLTVLALADRLAAHIAGLVEKTK